ncbi:hypothetical protein HMPREF9238_01576 [Gleimia europaea ACS-120-V-Col10b]|uniref:DUF6318 domain-containing protein n=2 Tax=Gleimia TaxID=2692113 RepID=A0A9W5RCW3_9ACTO|nr:hypothetical protein HMPREF9238_01576 [Gleimia europaea ACS-120-V-Col10b]
MRHLKAMTAVVLLGFLSASAVGCSSSEKNEAEQAQSSLTTTAITEVVTEAPTIPPADVLYPYPKPDMPPEAHEHSVLGAQAFSVYVLHMFGYAGATRDIDSFASLCIEDSVSCNRFLDRMKIRIEEGSYYEGYDLQVTRVNGSAYGGSRPEAEYGTQLAAFVPGHVFHDGPTGELVKFEDREIIGAVEVVWRDEWKVVELQMRGVDDD